MSNMKNGISTLNRWLGKKNKDKSATPNGKLSKSNTNLSLAVSTTDINETSQLEYNRITPLPAATSNAPFEQTFRITVLLPKDQLYVSRLGARVPLSKLLELVCENKLLDADKYEFRNPVDPSQVYSCDLTIGAVGLSEIRLCHKSDPYTNFNTEEVLKLHRTSVIRDSLSSSEFSSRNSKHTTKTASPYSSNNSLNSMDSTGMNYTRTPVSPPPALPTTAPPKIAAPPRKKRAAPRPPSQTAIPEKSPLVITKVEGERTADSSNNACLPQKDYYVSTPNLATSTRPQLSENDVHYQNGEASSFNQNNDGEATKEQANDLKADAQVKQKNERNLCGGSVQNLSNTMTEKSHEFPEPSPRKRLIQIKKKSAPAPPHRGSIYSEDSVSIKSMTPSTPGTPLTPGTPDVSDVLSLKSQESPKPLVRETTTVTKSMQPQSSALDGVPIEDKDTDVPTEPSLNAPKPVPRVTTATLIEGPLDLNTDNPSKVPHTNVSKVILNRTPTPEPRSFSTEPRPESVNSLNAQVSEMQGGVNSEDDDAASKQADSGIGEPVPSPIPDSLPSEGSTHECKSTFESSSDDDDMVKVYNFKLGKTLVKPLSDQKTLEDLTAIAAAAETDSGETTPATTTQTSTPIHSDTTSWNFSIPISPPPNFADNTRPLEHPEAETAPDTPITPKIKARPVLNFEAITSDTTLAKDTVDHCLPKPEETDSQPSVKSFKEQNTSRIRSSPLPSPTTPLNEIVDELSAIINQKRIDTLIKKVEDSSEIESAKPNTLSNFSITAISQQTTKVPEVCTNGKNSPAAPESSDEDKIYRKRSNITNNNYLAKQKSTVLRADSFHTTASPTETQSQTDIYKEQENGLNSRSSSYISLTKLEQNGLNLNRRRSSSELSIGESPSLQSPEVVKTILNSRKNSLANSSDSESNKQTNVELRNHIAESRVTDTDSRITNSKPKPKNETEKEVTNCTTVNPEPRAEEEVTKPKEVPRVYRYSGPPSINFSTWNERPKVQIAIKNEGDYIFGGKTTEKSKPSDSTILENQACSMPRNYRASMPATALKSNIVEVQAQQPLTARETSTSTSNSTPPVVAPKPTSPTKRMGIPEKEFRVPIVVKPLRDVTVDNIELRSNTDSNSQSRTQLRTNVTTVTLSNNEPLSLDSSASQQVKRPYSMATNTSTIPRVGANRFSTPIHGGSAVLRSTSITQLEASKSKSTQSEVAAPFGQNTLRKTGLKEKILAKEEQAQQQRTNVSVTNINVDPANVQQSNQIQNSSREIKVTNLIPNGCLNNSNMSVKAAQPLQSAKMELKLQKSTSVFVNHASLPATSRQLSMTKSAPVAPPPPPAIAPLKPKAQSNNTTNTTIADPRDQLLAAIRSFKRDELNRT